MTSVTSDMRGASCSPYRLAFVRDRAAIVEQNRTQLGRRISLRESESDNYMVVTTNLQSSKWQNIPRFAGCQPERCTTRATTMASTGESHGSVAISLDGRRTAMTIV